MRLSAALVGIALELSACCRPGAATKPFTPGELAAAERALLSRAGAGYTSVVVAPFVVLGNGPPSAVREQAAQTVAWARDLLVRDYFRREPGVIVAVWVFRDDDSYRSGLSALFGSLWKPDTPYGYYSPCERALVVNAAHGYGTLVHEMVHAYMDANFAEAPVWFNEGLASLYEQPSCANEDPEEPAAHVEMPAPSSPRLAGDLSLSRKRPSESTPEEIAALACARRGHIRGNSNWRLPLLKNALRQGTAPSWERMADAGRGAYNGKGGAILYATARYLLYWLQEKGVLTRYFHLFRAEHACDPSGLVTLGRVVDEGRPLASLRRDWESFIVALPPPSEREGLSRE